MHAFAFTFVAAALVVSASALEFTAPANATLRDEEVTIAKSTKLAKVYDKCKVANTAAITFDDGPYIYEKDLIPLLAKYKAKATFFLNGDNWACIYDDSRVSAIKALYAAGHELGGHTWTHAHLNKLNRNQINSEMGKVELALNRIVGVQPALFRPPYGEYDNLALSVIASRNQSAILWDLDSGDADGATVSHTNAIYSKFAKKHPSNILALNHSPYKTTVKQTIPHALEVLSAKGYKFVTVSQCLGIEPYQWTRKAAKKSSSWKC